MAEFQPHNPVEEEVRTEEDDPTNTTEEKVRTEEVVQEASITVNPELCDHVVIAQEPQVMIESSSSSSIVSGLLSSCSAINVGLGTDSLVTLNQIPRSDQTMNLASTSFASGQSRSLVPPNLSETQMSQVMMPPYEYDQIPRSDQTMNQEQRFTTPNRGSTSVASGQNNLNQSFGMQQQFSPRFAVDRNYAAGFGPNSAPWSPQVIRPFMPNQTINPRAGFVDHNYAPRIMRMPNQNIVPGTAFVVSPMRPVMYNQPQYQVVPTLVPGQAPMRPMMFNHQQDQIVPTLVPGQAPMRPMMFNHQQDQIVPTLVPGQAPMRPVMFNQQQGRVVPNLVPGQAPMRSMMNNQQQDQVVPNVVPGHAPMRPMMFNHQQDQVVPSLVPGQAPMMYNQPQDQVVPNLVPGQSPMRPMTNNQHHPMAYQLANLVPTQTQMMLPPNHTFNPRPEFVAAHNFFNQQPYLNATPIRYHRYPYMRPEANHQNLIMPQFRSDQMFTTISPSGQPRSFAVLQDPWNPQQHFVLSLDDAVVLGPLPEQPQPQTQQPTQSQGLNAGPSSVQGQDQ